MIKKIPFTRTNVWTKFRWQITFTNTWIIFFPLNQYSVKALNKLMLNINVRGWGWGGRGFLKSQWNLTEADTFGAKISVHLTEMSGFFLINPLFFYRFYFILSMLQKKIGFYFLFVFIHITGIIVWLYTRPSPWIPEWLNMSLISY